ncbi:hypothetical protein [Streptomyces scopuliridis]|uniref:hypothetical protein n=1 Tax=Streptomyces scopuliridis TaxID=452529 RepID=UPI003448C9FA
MSGLERLAARGPDDPTPEGFAAHLDLVSGDLLDVARPLDAATAVAWAERRASALDLDPGRIDWYLGRALAQTGSLGPDEVAEYRRNLAALVGDGPLGAVELFDAFVVLGREVVRTVRGTLPATDTVVFLGTDAEFLKLTRDLLTGDPSRTRTFYLSRLALLHQDEREVLAATRHEVFGGAGTSDGSATGAAGGRHFAWMDNGLVASQMFQLITVARDRVAAGDGPFGEVFPALFRNELAHGHHQARRRTHGPLTMFGESHPRVAEIIGRGIDEGRFAEASRQLAWRFRSAVPAEVDGLTIVDIGASGTQPCLLLGALGEPAPSVLLYTSGRKAWGPDTDRFRTTRITGRFAMAVESVKTFRTDYEGALRGMAHDLCAVPADQQLLAFLKRLAFHRAVLEERRA